MSVRSRWDRCIYSRGNETVEFMSEYFGQSDRNVLLIGGAGFDPRSTTVPESLARAMADRIQALLLQEERVGASEELIERARKNKSHVLRLIPKCEVASLQIFAADGAVVGGRTATQLIGERSLDGITDVVVDLTALSKGISFPIVKHLLGLAQGNWSLNLHLVVADAPEMDDEIVAIGSDRAGLMHGFKGSWGLDQSSNAAKLWLPQMTPRQHAILDRIHSFVGPHDVCPILPFPASNPRLGDELIEEYAEQFESAWEVDARDILYADEKNPLDLYRAILRIDDARKMVFESTGGSLIVLSPIGSKALAIGALMAAIDRDFPVAYVEAEGYKVDFNRVDDQNSAQTEFVHVWLHGEAYESNSAA